MVLSIAQITGIDLASIINNANAHNDANSIELSRVINTERENSDLLLKFRYNDYLAEYRIHNATEGEFQELLAAFRNGSYEPGKKSDYVIKTFFKALELWPSANPTDIWGFILSRIYQDPYNHPVTDRNRDFAQSWKRTSGWVLERIFVDHYKDFLLHNGIIIDTFSKSAVKDYLDEMELDYHDVKEKADVLLIDIATNTCFGVAHVKSSIAERRQADQSFSEALLAKNYFSPFLTLDCKSMPSATPIHKGEFGSPKSELDDQRANKRMDFEKQGYFSACFSYNSNTIPTPAGQKAAARIVTLDFNNPDDGFSLSTILARDRLFNG